MKRASPLLGYFHSQSKAGLAPGTLLHVGKKRMEKTHLHVLEYSEEQAREEEITIKKLPAVSKKSLQWINVNGLQDIGVLQALGAQYRIHDLLLEDILNTTSRPKIDEIDGIILIVVKMLRYDEKTAQLDIEQVSICCAPGLVITFQEQPGDVFDPIRERIRNGKTKIRAHGSDYLAYALLDAIVDKYLDTLQHFGGRMQNLENALMNGANHGTLQEIFTLKQDILVLQQMTWPLEEIIRDLLRSESTAIGDDIEPFMGDLEDHAQQVSDTLETYRMVLASMQDAYMSLVSNRMNEIMKTLTLIATIFIPLTFITGIYGMNFRHMPELEWETGYFMALGLMSAVGLVMLLYFRQKKWL